MSLPKPPATEELLATLNQPLPHSPDAEEGVLACLMNDPETYMPESITKLKADAFHSDTFREIFHTMQDLFICESPVTPVTVADRLRQAGNLDKVGGASRISELYTTTPASASIWAYCLEQMLDHWTTRRLIRASAETIVAAQNFRKSEPTQKAHHLVVEAEGRLTELQPASSRNGLQHIRHLLPGAVDDITRAYSNRGHVTRGIATGFTDLDRATMGIETGLFILAARPSKGKTVAMLQMAKNMGFGVADYSPFEQAPLPGGIWSLETEAQRLVRRMLCSHAQINLGRARDGMMSRQSQDDLRAAVPLFMASNIYLEACFGLSIQEFRVKVRQAVKRFGLKWVMVDYLQLLSSSSRAAQMSRTTMMAEVSNGLKALAHELDIPIFALAQINRDGDKPRPSMADIKDSGQIEQDADYIAILCDADGGDKDNATDDDDDPDGPQFVGLDLVKLKEGKTTSDGPPIRIRFDKEFFRMVSTTDKLFSNNPNQRQQ
jgi:replicative DNA helicase